MREDKYEKEDDPCPRCGGVVYRVYNDVDGTWMDDGEQCRDCGEWV